MTPPKGKPQLGLLPPPSGDVPGTPGPQTGQLVTVALLYAAEGGCDCDACKALRRMATTMRQEVLNA